MSSEPRRKQPKPEQLCLDGMEAGSHGGLETIERKSLIYRSGIGFFCVNHVLGCSHNCRYPCHAFLIASRYKRVKDNAEWCRPRLVGNALELLERELRRPREIDCVHLCLSTDPFMVGHPEVTQLSLKLIERLNRRGIPCSLLTKGLLPEELADWTRFRKDNTCGISLVSVDEEFRKQWEPGAASYSERIAAARRLQQRGCKLRIHMEPYPTPNLLKQDLVGILDQVSFADTIFLGGWNYHAGAMAYSDRESFYAEQGKLAREFCKKRGIRCEGWGETG